MEIRYEDAAPLRTTPCLAWVIEYESGGKDILATAPDMSVEDVIRMVQMHSHADFTVQNLTVGMWPLDEPPTPVPAYQMYMNDARKVSNDGTVDL